MIANATPNVGNTQMAAGPGPNDKQSIKSGQRQSMQMMNQKGAAPITDIRAKRQAATLNVEDLPGNNGGGQNIQGNQMNTSAGANNTQASIGSSSTVNPH